MEEGRWRKEGGGGRRYKGVFTEEQGEKFLRKNGSKEIFMEEQRGREKFLGFTPSRFVL